MNTLTRLEDITIRTTLLPGDMSYIAYLHATLYSREYGYGLPFEAYVLQGLNEFYQQYNPDNDRFWIAEHNNRIVGCLLLMNRGAAAQLRYFILEPAYRGIGLGRKLMELYMEFLKSREYTSSYLWTTEEQTTAAGVYKKYGFVLMEEKESAAFGKRVKEQRYELKLQ